MFITRAYNHFDISEETGTVTKRSKEERLGDEIEHYRSLPSEIRIWFPRLLNSGFDSKTQEHFLTLEFYAYPNLGSYLIDDNVQPDLDWHRVAKIIGRMISEFKNRKFDAPFESDMQKMYVDKTVTEYEKLKAGFDTFQKMCSHSSLVIDDVEYQNFESVWASLKEKGIEKVLYSDATATFFHGDLCFSNILIGRHQSGTMSIKCLDPRGKFGKLTCHGDPYYDIAKLMHSTDGGYEYFINDKFAVQTNDELNSISLTFDNNKKEAVHKVFLEEIYSQFNLKKVKLIQGCIFIGMCARHYDSLNRQIAMYATGVRLLNEVLKEM